MNLFKHNYYFLVFKYQGKIGCWLLENCRNEKEANSKGMEKLAQKGILFEVVELSNKDKSEAMQKAKARWGMEKGDVDSAMNRGLRRPPPDNLESGAEAELPIT